MTGHSAGAGLQILVDGRPASAPLRDTHAVARKLVRHFADNVTPCGSLPGEQLQSDVTDFTVVCLRLGIQMLDGGTSPTDEDLAEVRDASARWAREGFPLTLVLRILHEGITKAGDLAAANAREEDLPGLLVIQKVMFALLECVTVAATTSYVNELEAVNSERDGAAVNLVTALLSGRKAASAARHAGVEPAENYVVMGLAVPPHPAEAIAHRRKAVVARQKLRRLQIELAEASGGAALCSLSPDGGTILLPGSPERAWIVSLLDRVGAAAEVPLTATVSRVRTADIPTAAEQVHELLDLAHQLSLAPGLYEMNDLALEYQLTRPGPGRTHLARLLDPLQNSPELVETLEVHISHDLNRQRTAKKMHLHTNTVDYRLKRIAQLTGCDPTRPSGLRQIQAALVARKLEVAQREG
ncbi:MULTISPECIES: helix-turn-helix domain-containing protein [Rhodococcus]|uniref:Helix-turn-helix domain-containing protein n=1 Tax=Rhodococcus oxybenzonivorans TaxID=1990687 RepID=A0AAE4V042_9NOCA|nr:MULTISPECIES: helix-turn-helix domain-containing protein [Rhodococcus]MDV7245714.1 helix-turn-helix domain-containing protein [Rhodococcus oxybenzonivorans]MDV7265862.1 helix-turn-helix domain-containing protein [Rhodococcus oxybenzonivorans]MDV7276931.1 helix-turn-helix domain-containing protein [Rhodococcus oxybenzonivorans]MDV7336737.1 helix-turn-helix domain-containing protein [Rhodococcus oxybenzonivorans]MDV7346615.1 helix-turn-helix domain-containing protein [Rhodococcus oxybenzonivo